MGLLTFSINVTLELPARTLTSRVRRSPQASQS